jgi:hypothetical protein
MAMAAVGSRVFRHSDSVASQATMRRPRLATLVLRGLFSITTLKYLACGGHAMTWDKSEKWL